MKETEFAPPALLQIYRQALLQVRVVSDFSLDVRLVFYSSPAALTYAGFSVTSCGGGRSLHLVSNLGLRVMQAF